MLRRIAATAAAMAAVAAVPAALAAATGAQQGAFSVPYSCSVSPVTAAMDAGATSATGTGSNAYSANGDTVYTLSALTLNGPAGVNNGIYSGTIAFRNPANGVIVSNSSTAAPVSSDAQLGLASATGSTTFTFNTAEPAFRGGNYTMSATLSCASAL